MIISLSIIIIYQYQTNFEYPYSSIFVISLCLSVFLSLSFSGWSEAVLWGFCYSVDRRQTAPYVITLTVCVYARVS